MPTRASTHIDRPLSNFSVAYAAAQQQFAAGDLFGIVPVQKKSDKYFIRTKGESFRTAADRVAPGAEAPLREWTLSNDTYSCERYAIGAKLPDEDEEGADDEADLVQGYVETITADLLIKRDLVWATAFFGASIWDTDQTGVSGSPGANEFKQFDASGSDPIGVIRAATTAIHTQTGSFPACLALGRQVYDVLVDHSDIVARLPTTSLQLAMEADLAKLFGLKKVKVLDTIYNSAKQGQTASMARVFGKSMLLAVEPSGTTRRSAAPGKVFSWSRFDDVGKGVGSNGALIKKWWDDDTQSWKWRGDMYFDCKVTATDLARFFATAVG